MKSKIFKTSFVVFIVLTMTFIQTCHAFSFKGSYSSQNMAKYYPQQYNYRYQRPQRNYVYSAQQAKYYGYSAPQATSNSYYNPYLRR